MAFLPVRALWLVLLGASPAGALPAARQAARHPVAAAHPVVLAHAVVSSTYSEQLHLAAGSAQAQAPFTFALSGGALPACVHLATDGLLTGSPEADCVGTYRFNVVLTSFNGEQTAGTFLLHVDRAGALAERAPVSSPAAEPVNTPGHRAGSDSGSLSGSTLENAHAAPAGPLPASGGSEQEQGGNRARTHGAVAAPGVSEAVAPAGVSPIDCGLLIHTALADGSTQVAGTVNKAVVGAQTLIAFCRTQEQAAASCSEDGANRFDALSDTPNTLFAVPKDGAFTARLVQPLAYGESLNAVLLHPEKTCTEQALGAAGTARSAAPPAQPEVPRAAPGFAPGPHPAGSPAGQAVTSPVASPVASPAAFLAASQVPSQVSSQGVEAENEAGGHAAVDPAGQPKRPEPTDGAPDAEPILSPSVSVAPGADWGRIRTTFVGGVLLANDSSQFSSAHQFFELLLEKYWSLPGCYLKADAVRGEGPCLDAAGQPGGVRWLGRHTPGVTTWFDTRLTAIPVSQNSGSAPAANFLTTQKSARVGVGGDLPFLLKRWQWAGRPNALFLAPLAETGFDTLTSSLTQTVVGSDGGTTQATFARLYNFYAFGGRVGHYQLGRSSEVAPEWQSYLDVVSGRYSNLQSYICEPVAAKPRTYKALPASGCAGAYGGLTTDYVDSLKRPYRLDLEGALKIPYLPLLVGFNANLGQHALSTGHIDPAYSTPDDLRFLFATKFDVATLLTRLGVPAATK